MIKIHLSELLKQRKMQQCDLSKLTGIREATISDICHGTCISIKIRQIDRICQALDCTAEMLFSYEITNKESNAPALK